MKKIFSIAFLPLYLITIFGFNSNIHHCGGKVSVEIFGIDFNKHCNCNHIAENHSADCCQDHQIQIKAIDSDKVVSNVIAIPIKSMNFFLSIRNQIDQSVNYGWTKNKLTVYFPADHPPASTSKIYLINKVFLI